MSQPMSAAESQKPYVRRNFKIGVVNGSLWLLAKALTDPDTVLPAFAVALMGSDPLYVGLLVSVVNAGWFWPPLLMTSVMATRKRRHPFYRLSAVVRISAIAAAWASVYFLAGDYPLTAFVAIGLCYLAYTSGGGIGLIPFRSVGTDSIPPNRRGRFFAMRLFFGGLMAFAAGFWIKWLLSDQSGLEFPRNYALLFGAATFVSAASLLSWWNAHEPAHKVETRSLPLRIQLLRGLRRLRTRPGFLRFVASRLGMAISYGLVVPFLVPYAYANLGMTEAMVGIAVASRVICYAMLNILWSRLSARHGNRALLVAAGLVNLLGISLVLITPLLPAIPLGTLFGLQFDLRLALLMLVFGAVGAADSGQNTGQNSYLLEYAPERTRPVYLAIYYLLAFPLAFMPVLTAVLIGQSGRFVSAFAIGAVAALLNVGLYASLRRLRGDDERDAAPAS